MTQAITGPTSTRTPTASHEHRLPTLTGMRFAAAAAVFLCHFSLYIRGNGDFWRTLGEVGVSFFFVLSGFVLTWSTRPETTARTFWRRRAAKVYPNHLVVAAAHAGLLLLTGKAIVAAQILPTATLTQSWLPRFNLMTALSPVSWTLSCEVFFYLAFPLLVRQIRRMSTATLWWVAGALVATIFALPAIALHFIPAGQPVAPLLPYLNNDTWFVGFFPLARLLEFALGMTVARIVAAGKWPQIGLLPATALLALGYWMAMETLLCSFAAATVVPIALVICAGAVADVEGHPSPLRHPYLIWLGEVSFALYLVHKPVIDYGAKLLGIPHFSTMGLTEQVVVGIPMLIVSLLLAWLLHLAVERPAMRHWGRPRTASAGRHRGACPHCGGRLAP
ncbi:acyltransferase family protein [Streptomyces sp. NPDC048696]|uniref:acyltransferase family protein n=1 Tax=Streptomyces sp. NPDC048696 TaxID=3365585 RepID=UPI003720997A